MIDPTSLDNVTSTKLKDLSDATPLNERISGVSVYLRKFWYLVAPFWQSPETRARAWVLTSIILIIEGFQLWFTASLSFASAEVMNVLDLRELERFWSVFWYWMLLVGASLVSFALQYYVQYHLLFQWRAFLTGHYLSKYLCDGRFHQMELSPYGVDNPDQRIAADIDKITSETFRLSLIVIKMIGNTAIFSFILWSVSGALSFSFQSIDITIPGYMFWAAIVFSVFQIWIADRIGRPIVSLTYLHHAVEADFRHHLVRIRENTEGIALLNGENNERQNAGRLFERIRINWFELMQYQMRLMVLNLGISRLSMIIPYIVAMPALMSGSIALGSFIQLRQAWGSVEGSLSWFATAYGTLAAWKASIDRVLLLAEGVRNAERIKASSEIKHSVSVDGSVKVDDLYVFLPNDESLISSVSFDLVPGQHALITGPTGSGKSTLFRVLSKHWVWGSGQINLPDAKLMFLPQKPYMPKGTLRAALTYPNQEDSVSDELLQTYLIACQLEDFANRLSEIEDWARVLSGGEQQRLSLVRACLMQPDWLFLDEATSALDPDTETRVYTELAHSLPKTTLVSIAHRDSLKKFHEVELQLDRGVRSISKIKLAAQR